MKKLGIVTTYPTSDCEMHRLSVVLFTDAGRHHEIGQLSYVAGLVLDDLSLGSLFHSLSWSSYRAKRPVRSVGAAEVLAAGDGIDEGQMLTRTLSSICGVDVRLIVALDSKDLFTSLSTQRQSIDKSIRADANVIRYAFERGYVN